MIQTARGVLQTCSGVLGTRAGRGMRFNSSRPSESASYRNRLCPSEAVGRRNHLLHREQSLIFHSKAGVMESNTQYLILSCTRAMLQSPGAAGQEQEQEQVQEVQEAADGAGQQHRRHVARGDAVTELLQLQSETPVLLVDLRQRLLRELKDANNSS
jgi:hypothetical protein